MTIDIDAQLLAKLEKLAREKGMSLTVLVEEALRGSLGEQGESTKPYGEPLEDTDIEESARVTFRMLDEEEERAAKG